MDPLNNTELANDPNSPWIIRRATPEDIPIIIEFEQGLAQETEGKTLDADLIRRGVEAPFSQPNLCTFFVAEEKNEVIGFIALGQQWDEWQAGLMYYIFSTYVSQNHRRRGIFSSLFEFVRRFVQNSNEAVGMRLYVETENEKAMATYKALGMEVENFQMMKWMKLTDLLPAKQEDAPMPGAEPVIPEHFPKHYPWKIRLAVKEDIPTIIQMEQAFAKEARPDIKVDPEVLKRGVSLPFESPNLARFYVAEEEGSIIAMLMVTIEWSEWKGGMVYWLTSSYVVPEHRKKGVLTSLYNFAKSAAKDEVNAIGLRMQVDRGNTKGLEAGARLGMQAEPYNLMRWTKKKTTPASL